MERDFGVNAGLVDELYARWTADPDSVAPSFCELFQRGRERSVDAAPAPALEEAAPAPQPVAPADHEAEVLDQAVAQARVYQLVQAYRARGQLHAHLDPLSPPPAPPPE